MAAFGHTSTDIQIEAHSLPSLNRGMVAQVAKMPLISVKIELQESGITQWIQPANGKMADLNSKIENGGGTKVKKRHLRPKRKKVLLERGAQPGNQNACKHGKYTRERRAVYAEARARLRNCQALYRMAMAFTSRSAPWNKRENSVNSGSRRAALLRGCSMGYKAVQPSKGHSPRVRTLLLRTAAAGWPPQGRP